MKKYSYIYLTLTFCATSLLAGCSNNTTSISNSLDERVQAFEQKMLEIENENLKLKKEISSIKNEIDETKKMIPIQQIGTYYVVASELNLRKGASTDYETIGTARYGTQLNIIDTSNPQWYKVKLDFNEYTEESGDYSTSFSKDNFHYTITNKNISNKQLVHGNEYYVRSSYLNKSEQNISNIAPQNGKNPFTYGILFFDSTIESLLENEIWTQMSDELISAGYDTIDIVPVDRNTYEEDFLNNKYDAVESAPGQFARINASNPKMEVFAKDILDGVSSYEGIILVNKNSGITNFDHLIGKTVLTGKEYSESSYQYQKNYLKNVEGIDIETDLRLQKDNYHQVIFYEVAKGNASVGFCGDFVLTDGYSDMKDSLAKSDIILESEAELEQLRSNVLILPMKGAEPIPNNPHSIINELANNTTFVDKLYACVERIYNNNKEDAGLIKASTKEYDVLIDMQ